jgi:hypothetical protein
MRLRGYRNSTLTDSQHLSIDLIDLNDTYKVRSLRIVIAGQAFSCSMHVIEIRLTAKAIKARPNRAWSFALPPHWKRRVHGIHRGHDDECEEAKDLSGRMHASDAPQRIGLYFPPISALISLELRVFTGTVHTSPPVSWVTRTDPASLVDI